MSSAPAPPPLTRLNAAVVERVLAANPRVRRLNLSRHAIARLGGGGDGGADDAALARLAALVELDVSRNALRRLGAELAPFAALQVLDVSRNEMCAPRGGGARAWERRGAPGRGELQRGGATRARVHTRRGGLRR